MGKLDCQSGSWVKQIGGRPLPDLFGNYKRYTRFVACNDTAYGSGMVIMTNTGSSGTILVYWRPGPNVTIDFWRNTGVFRSSTGTDCDGKSFDQLIADGRAFD